MRFIDCLILTCGSLGLFVSHVARGEPLTVDGVIAKVREAEARSRAVEVKGFSGQDFTENEDGTFAPTPRCIEGDVVRDGVLAGRYLLEVRKYTIPSADFTRYFSRASIESFDGREGRYVDPRTTRGGEIRSRGSVTISVGALGTQGIPTRKTISYETMSDGSAATLGYFEPFIDVAESKSNLLGEALAGMKKLLSVAEEEIDGVKAVKVWDTIGNTYWFDPARGFALIRAKSADGEYGANKAFRRLFVDELVQLDTDTWYASKGRWEGKSRPFPDSPDKIEFAIKSASLLRDPKFEYKAKILEGYVVHDLAMNRVFTANADGAEPSASTQPTATPAGGEEAARPPQDERSNSTATETSATAPSRTASSPEAYTNWLPIAVGGGVAGIAFLVGVIQRKREG